jgi:biotin carboxylase
MPMITVLCLASYEKGHAFLRACKQQGCRVFLLTSLSLKDTAHWPRESLDDIFYMPDDNKRWDHNQTIFAVSHLARSRKIDRIVPLDDFDLELAASLREHLRIAGMGESTTRYFRDKLAMRMRAEENDIRVPPFVHLLNDERVRTFTEHVPPPWVLKPRSLAGAIGIKLVHTWQELQDLDHSLGDERSFHLLEKFIPGDVFHVDSIVCKKEIVFAVASAYGRPPMEVSHGGGIFTTRILERGSEIERSLLEINARVLPRLGLLRGVSHTEFIRSHDGEIYFLETSARVGGAHIADLVEVATGINLWAEWAKVEVDPDYRVPPVKTEYAGLLVSLAKQEHPDTSSSYTDPEIVWRMDKANHVGMIVASPRHERVTELLESLTARVRQDFHASVPPRERPSD